MNISYDDMNKMPFFEILKLLEVYEEHMKEQQKANEKENARIENQMSSMQKNYSHFVLYKPALLQYNGEVIYGQSKGSNQADRQCC